MQRCLITPRPDWQRTVEAQGMPFYMTGAQLYWDEGVFYAFSESQIDRLESATEALNEMCLSAVQAVFDETLWYDFAIPAALIPLIRDSWNRRERSIYGRFDFAFDGQGEPKLLEYNADTPTSLIEAAVIQWFWLQDWQATPEAQSTLRACGGASWDQFNLLHERLIEAWQSFGGKRVYFSSLSDSDEDMTTVAYLRETAMQAGVETEWIDIARIGWNARKNTFVDEREKPISHIFKLYPWEWLALEPFGAHLPKASTRWIEPSWKMLLSNKALLPLLWRMFPGSPYLLRAESRPWSDTYVCKPILAREGANLRIVRDGQVIIETSGPYEGRVIYQEYRPLTQFGDYFPIIGSWVINGHAAGIGIREDTSIVTGNQCRFIPHAFWKS